MQQALSQANEVSQRALQFAAMEGDAETVSNLVARGLNINAGDHDGRSSLHHAAYCNNQEVVQILLDKGADPLLRDTRHVTPLEIAIDMNHDAVALCMIAHGARLPCNQFSRFFTAAEQGRTAVSLLKKAGGDINSRCAVGSTALHEHCLRCNRRAVQVLLEADADPTLKDLCVPPRAFLDTFALLVSDSSMTHKTFTSHQTGNCICQLHRLAPLAAHNRNILMLAAMRSQMPCQFFEFEWRS